MKTFVSQAVGRLNAFLGITVMHRGDVILKSYLELADRV
jgi:hypothetical protein